MSPLGGERTLRVLLLHRAGTGQGATREVLSLALVPVWSDSVICRHFTNSPVHGRKLASLISGVCVCDWLGP